MLNDGTCWWSANVQQHCVDANEIFIISIHILWISYVKNEIFQCIFEIRMQIAENIDECLIIHRAAILRLDHYNEQLGHQHTIFTYYGWHPKLVEPHCGHMGIFDRNDQSPEMIWHTTNHGLHIFQICLNHQRQTIQIEFPADRVREHASLLDMVQWHTRWNDVVNN